jgi:hypothetical protein
VTTGWAIYAPMGFEARALRAGLRTAEGSGRTGGVVLRTGVGPRRARRAAGIRPAPSVVAIAGLCGGLRPDLRPGDVVVADDVRVDALTAGANPAPIRLPAAPVLAAALRRHGLTVHTGTVISTDHLVSGADRDRLAVTGALAADLESVWLLSGRTEAALACVRVIADPAPGGLLRPATLAHLRTALRTLPAVAAGLVEWAAATTVRRMLLTAPRTFCADPDDPAAADADVVLVLGSANSSNSRRLVETAQRSGTQAYLVDDAAGVDLRWLAGATTVGVIAGASARPRLVGQTVAVLRGLGARDIDEHVETTEDVRFTLPEEVRPA